MLVPNQFPLPLVSHQLACLFPLTKIMIAFFLLSNGRQMQAFVYNADTIKTYSLHAKQANCLFGALWTWLPLKGASCAWFMVKVTLANHHLYLSGTPTESCSSHWQLEVDTGVQWSGEEHRPVPLEMNEICLYESKCTWSEAEFCSFSISPQPKYLNG